jgi:hypothetical protein
MLLAANAFIIYFAIGVPFALLTVLVNRGRLEIQDVARSFANLALWPLIAIGPVTKMSSLPRPLKLIAISRICVQS